MYPTKRNSSIHIITQKVVSFSFPLPDTDVSFPSAWFERNPNKKPEALIRKYEGTFENLVKSVQGGINAASLTLDTAKIYMYEYGRRMQDDLDAKWTSYKLVIGDKDAKISPWDIVSIKIGDVYLPPEPMASTPLVVTEKKERPDLWSERSLMLYITSVYRLARLTNQKYQTAIRDRLVKQLATEGGTGMTLYNAETVYRTWINDRSYRKMIAAIDMFLLRFKTHEESIIRMGTLSSRYRDCAALLSMGYAMSILKVGCGDLMDWIFIPKMANEMKQLAKGGEESGKTESYFPYQSDLGLITKSAYSSVANPYLFHWIHIFGALLGHKRSQNARFNFDGSYADVGLNAVLVVWVFSCGGKLSAQSENGKDYGAEIEALHEEDDDDVRTDPQSQDWLETQGRSPQAWFALLKSRGFKVPKRVDALIIRQRGKITSAKDNSVGDYVKNRLTY